ncbi:hypothetical protein ONJ17_27575, partial [Salmonella enterica subsp. enterica serovar Agona]|nr:hypothetical protein [Salmonella enterica subsp. enterica serovar Agona]
VAGDELWEMAIFDLYNRILESGKTRLLITGDRPPRQLNLGLPVQQFCQAGRCIFRSDLRCCWLLARGATAHTILVVRITGTGRN